MDVRFGSIVHHFMVGNGSRGDGSMHDMFFEYLAHLAAAPPMTGLTESTSINTFLSDDDDEQPGKPGAPQGYSLALVVGAVEHFLRQPLHPCDHCNRQYRQAAQQNHERWVAIEAYTPLRRHPLLFDPARCWDQVFVSWAGRVCQLDGLFPRPLTRFGCVDWESLMRRLRLPCKTQGRKTADAAKRVPPWVPCPVRLGQWWWGHEGSGGGAGPTSDRRGVRVPDAAARLL
jgi:hypothetical protein